jgi:hypothetical protein
VRSPESILCFHAAVEPGQGLGQERASGRAGTELEAGKLVDVAARLEPKPPDQIELCFVDQVHGELTAAFDQRVRVVPLVDRDELSRH